MNYHLRRDGVELGVFSLEELRQRRAAGELTGREYLQGEGRNDWLPLDLFLQQGGSMPPPIPKPAGAVRSAPSAPIWVWAIVAAGLIFFAVVIGIGVKRGINAARIVQKNGRSYSANTGTTARSEAAELASQPVHWTTNTLTDKDVKRMGEEFDRRQWVDAYRNHAAPGAPENILAEKMFEAWIAGCYHNTPETNAAWLEKLGNDLARQTNFNDPLALAIAGITSAELFEGNRRLERAMKSFEHSDYRAYPKFVTAVRFAGHMKEGSARQIELDALAVKNLRLAFTDGSLLPRDERLIAEILVNGWGYNFFKRNHAAVNEAVQTAGQDHHWLVLVLSGEEQIIEAWDARGSGYANTVTEAGWEGFRQHLASARKAFTAAAALRPEVPLAACRMMKVALGESDPGEMRQWFDKAVMAQLDYTPAWKQMRWGLRPRWFGDEEAMLAFGITAANTGRFDTDVPRMLFDSLSDVESEENLAPGEHIYRRDDVWPSLQKMYEGYIAAPDNAAYRKGWRSSYAAVAYFAGKYDVAREQFEALEWQPNASNISGWNADTSLMALEVAARTGPAKKDIDLAESQRRYGHLSKCLEQYHEIANSTNADTRTREFVADRLASLEVERQLEKGGWVDFQPANDHDPNWVIVRGGTRVLPDGALEVSSGPLGHFLYSRVRVGPNFEMRGEFETVRSSTSSFQAGVVMGMPDIDTWGWDAFRMKRNLDENEVINFSCGWADNGISRKIALNDTTNSFVFTFENSRGTAFVNGIQAMRNAETPRETKVRDDDFLAGLGAYNDVNDTVIRYRHIQLRRIKPTTKLDRN